MKIKFSKQVRAALKGFSKVDRREYVQNVVANQLTKDGRIEVPSDAEQKESEPVTSETPRPIHPASGSGDAGGGGRGSVSPPVFYAGGGGSIGSSGSVCSAGGVTSEFGTVFRGGITLRVPSRSNALELEGRSPASDVESGGDSSSELLPFQQEMQQAIERGYKVSFFPRDWIPPSEVIVRSPGSVGTAPNSSGGGSIVIDEYDAEQKESEPVTSETSRPVYGSGYVGGLSTGGNACKSN